MAQLTGFETDSMPFQVSRSSLFHFQWTSYILYHLLVSTEKMHLSTWKHLFPLKSIKIRDMVGFSCLNTVFDATAVVIQPPLWQVMCLSQILWQACALAKWFQLFPNISYVLRIRLCSHCLNYYYCLYRRMFFHLLRKKQARK